MTEAETAVKESFAELGFSDLTNHEAKPTKAHRGARHTRAVLRDSIRRCHLLHTKVSREKLNDDDVFDADDFYSLQSHLERELKEIREEMIHRNECAKEKGGRIQAIEITHNARKTLDALTKDLSRMKDMNDGLLRNIAAKKRKKNSPSEAELKQAWESRTHIYERLLTELDAVATLVQDRPKPTESTWWGGKKDSGTTGAITVDGPSGATSGVRRTRLMDLNLDEAATQDRPAGDDLQQPDEQYQAQMAAIDQQELQINKKLDDVKSVILRLKEGAVRMGEELDDQNVMLEVSEENMEKASKDLDRLNSRLDRVMKKMRPTNCFLNLCCGVILLAIVSYLVYRFRRYIPGLKDV
eukprot:NODE_2164_length_1185_cov_17.116197_g1795_i0.p1 GENE.NODE_2164_length_1185_cov_17.116197_g1795_i0~~NODE_2164_length_1185_cov_17.116197_g1795_i0.p1  ORF type:complete len:355 (+),score=85.49 NODE_2164_length_1185_cov_17.116197_g1795_i0:83-1147(+)